LSKLRLKIYLNWLTILSLFLNYPLRLVRFVFHFFQWIPQLKKQHLSSKGPAEWIIDFGCYIADLFMIPDILEFVYVWIQPKMRLLNNAEKEAAKKYFGNKVNLRNVRISYQVPKGIMSWAIAFVTFNTIHYSRPISKPVFIHEMVHIWQYQKFGSVYIYRAIKAQRSLDGYNYGGLENLYSKMLNNYFFTDFNFEQQGEIFEDYCKLKESGQMVNPIAEASFEYFVGQVRNEKYI